MSPIKLASFVDCFANLVFSFFACDFCRGGNCTDNIFISCWVIA